VFNLLANVLGLTGETYTVFMHSLSHTVIRTTHKTNNIYRKFRLISNLFIDCFYLESFTVSLGLSYYLQNWGNYADMSQGVVVYMTYTIDVLLICWFGTQLTQHVRKINYCQSKNAACKVSTKVQRTRELQIAIKSFFLKFLRRRV